MRFRRTPTAASGLRLAGAVALPLLLLSTLAGHWLGYRLAVPDEHRRAHALERTGHGYLELAPALVSVLVFALVAALAWRFLAIARGRPVGGASASLLVPLPFAAFLVQEHVERLVGGHGISATTVMEPAVLVGLAAQVPLAMLALAVARGLDAAVAVVARALRRSRLPRTLGAHPVRRLTATFLVTPAPLALGQSGRGPPIVL